MDGALNPDGDPEKPRYRMDFRKIKPILASYQQH